MGVADSLLFRPYCWKGSFVRLLPERHTPAMKDVGFRIRVQREHREQFLEACRSQDKPAAQVLREFMREHVDGIAATESKSRNRNEV